MDEILKFCRVCLVPEEDTEFQSLFDKKGNYAEKIANLSGIKVIEEKIPQIICKSCIQELNSADMLRLQIIDADEYINCVLINESKALVLEKKSKDLGKQIYEDYEDTIPADKISKVNIKTENRTNIIKKSAAAQSEPPPVSSQATKPLVIKTKLKSPPIKVNKEPVFNAKSLTIAIKITEEQKVTKEVQADEINNSPQLLGSKRNRRISSKLMESSEPAAKRIKRMHLLVDEIDVKKKSLIRKCNFKCDRCSIGFATQLELMKHIQVHTVAENFTCFFCSESFSEYSVRIIHMQKLHSGELRKRYTSEKLAKRTETIKTEVKKGELV